MPLLRPHTFHRAIYLTGATASGKTAVGIALARLIDAEVIALDSMTLYRGMNIGTAKPTPSERQKVPHHLIDVLNPWESASVAQYREWAENAVSQIEAIGKKALFVGGTPMYLKSLLRGLFVGPGANEDLRKELEAEAERLGNQAMHDRLAKLDPLTASRLHPNDRRRIIRALEVLTSTGLTLSSLQREHDTPAPSDVVVIALQHPSERLHARINRRVVTMFEEGLLEEVDQLMKAPRPIGPVAAQGVGYREVIDLLNGKIDLQDAIAQIQARTRQFAKRQGTWFRGLAEVRFWPVPEGASPESIAEHLANTVIATRSAGSDSGLP